MSLRQKFNKAVIIGLAALTLGTGIASTAQAQDRGFPQGGTVTATQTQTANEDYKPWANNPRYIAQVNAIEQQSEARLNIQIQRLQIVDARQDQAMTQQLRRQQQQIQRINQQHRANKARHNGGETKWGVIGVLDQVNQGMTTVRIKGAQDQSIAAQVQLLRMNEELRVQSLVDRIDAQYASQYLSAAQQQERAAALADRKAHAQDVNTMTPDQLHDALLLKYQKAVIATAGTGKPMPTPESYGLSKNDPGLQIGGPSTNR